MVTAAAQSRAMPVKQAATGGSSAPAPSGPGHLVLVAPPARPCDPRELPVAYLAGRWRFVSPSSSRCLLAPRLTQRDMFALIS